MIYENRKQLKKTSLKYFGYGSKILMSYLTSYYIISYTVLIALHGLMIYGAYACCIAGNYGTCDGLTRAGYVTGFILLFLLSSLIIFSYGMPISLANKNEDYFKYIADVKKIIRRRNKENQPGSPEWTLLNNQ